MAKRSKLSAAPKQKLLAQALLIEAQQAEELERVVDLVNRHVLPNVEIADIRYAVSVALSPDELASISLANVAELKQRLSRFDFKAKRQPLHDDQLRRAVDILGSAVDDMASVKLSEA